MTKCNFTKKLIWKRYPQNELKGYKNLRCFGRSDASECWLSITGVDNSFYSLEFDGNLFIFSKNVIERLVPAAAEQIIIVSIKATNGWFKCTIT